MSSKCLLHSFLIVVKIGTRTSNKIPSNTPAVKGMGGVRKHSREVGRLLLLYELFNLFAGSWSLPLPRKASVVQVLSRLPGQFPSPAASQPTIWAK